MIDLANRGRGQYEIAVPVTVLEDWIANARVLVGQPLFKRAEEEVIVPEEPDDVQLY